MSKETTILEIFDKVEEDKSNSKEYSKLLSKFINFKEKFSKEIAEEQQKDLEYLLDLITDMNEQSCKEFFIDGFSIATKIMAEVYCKENNE